MSLSARVASAAFAVVLFNAGCPAFTSDGYLYREGFDACAGTSSCAFALLDGPEGSAVVAETFPGERGLHLTGDTSVLRVFPGLLEVPGGVSISRSAIDIVGRCDEDSFIEVDVAAVVSTGERVTLAPVTNLPSTWQEGRRDLDVLGVQSTTLAAFDAISIRKSGPGVCEIDEIGIFVEQRSFAR